MARMNLTVITTHDAYKIEQLIDTCGVYCVDEPDGVHLQSDDDLSKQDCIDVLDKLDDANHIYRFHADDFFLNQIMRDNKIMYKMQCVVDNVTPSHKGFYKYMKEQIGEVLMPDIHELNEYFTFHFGGFNFD